MGNRTPNPRRVKIHRSHTVEEIARLFGVHKNTVRGWLKSGLTPIDGHRPTVVHGTTLQAFLEERRAKRKCKCPPGHFYCLRCRSPREPYGKLADYIPLTASSGNLKGLCPECDGYIFRRVAFAKIDAMRAHLDITVAQDDRRIRES